ncbi:MAG: tetratricopeptide repeat protein [Desulfarculaceae bacterium]
MPEPTLGLIMILRNEAANLGRSLAPVASCFDQVVVVDTGSEDGTRDLCRRMGASVFDYKWGHDFAAARNFSISKATADWLFWLDGDNAITPQDVVELRRVISSSRGEAILWALEKVEPQGGRLWQKRCFPRSPKVRFQGRVHEQLVHPPEWPALATNVIVRHWGYCDPAQTKAKGLYYLELLNKSLQEDPEDFYSHFQIARCYLNLRRFKDASDHLAQVAADPGAREKNPQLWVHAHILSSRVCVRMGLKEEAAAILDQLLAQDHLRGLAHYERGRLAYSQGDWQATVRHLDQAVNLGLDQPVVDLDPERTMFQADYFLGRALYRLRQYPQAAAAMIRAVSRQPGNLAARNDLARIFAEMGHLDQAREQLNLALSIRPQDRQASRLLKKLDEAA